MRFRQSRPARGTARPTRSAPLLAALAALAACAGSSDRAAVAATPTPVDGTWDFVAPFAQPFAGGTCTDSGSLRLAENGAAIAGRIQFLRTCTFAGSSVVARTLVTDSVSATRAGAVIMAEERTLRGGTLECTDTLTVGAGGAAILGVGTCGTSVRAINALRGAPIATGVIHPDTLSMRTGTIAQQDIDFRTAAGHRAFLRPVAWASADNAIATVTPDGIVSAVGGGVTTVTATSEGHVASVTIIVPGPVAFTRVGAGNARTCALDATGAALCWGARVVFGGPGGSVPEQLGGGLAFVELSVGADHACGRTSANTTWCWGSNAFGQLGTGTTVDAVTPQQVVGAPVLVSLSAGGDHTCGLTAAGAAWCWGSDSLGQLGRGGSNMSPVPVAVSGGIVFRSLSAGPRHTCGIAMDQTLYCWGDNAMGQVGDSTTTSRSVPVPVHGGGTWSAVSTGYWRTCALTTLGAAYCWGSAGFGGSLGTPNFTELAPAPVNGNKQFTAITVGGNHACALDAAGAAWCWGVNLFGQLGTGSSGAPSGVPAAVAGGHVFASISAGSYDYSDEAINGGTAAHTCASTTTGVIWCWGVNNIGQVGNGTTDFSGVATPAKVAGQP